MQYKCGLVAILEKRDAKCQAIESYLNMKVPTSPYNTEIKKVLINYMDTFLSLITADSYFVFDTTSSGSVKQNHPPIIPRPL